MRIVVLYDPGGPDWSPTDVRSILQPVAGITQIFQALGHEVRRVAVRPNLRWLARCRKADLVFNFCEGVEGRSALEELVVGTLELSGVPYTGCGPWTIAACHRKDIANTILGAEGLPVPRWYIAENSRIPDDFPLPAIVKPAAEDASSGIDGESVCSSRRALREKVARVSEHFDEVLVQQYIAGREFNVGFVGERVLPVSEIDYSTMPGGHWPILSYRAKWEAGSPEDAGSRPVCPAEVEPALARRIVKAAEVAWRAMRGRGYGRVDLRVDAEGTPWVLEVNPNPDISDDAGLSRMAQAVGWSYEALVVKIAETALERSASAEAVAAMLAPPAARQARPRAARRKTA